MALNFNDHEIERLDSVRDWIRFGSSRFSEAKLFFGHGTDNAWDEAAVLVLWSIHQPWEKLDVILDSRLTDQEKTKIISIFDRRITERTPAAYLTGESWFAGYKFKVDQSVLVPRSPIAELIQSGFEPWLQDYPNNILDLCCGSGCIGIACAMVFDEAMVELSDISEKAIAIAEYNIAYHQLSNRVKATLSDGFESITEVKYDLIVSNPPYVDAQDFASMPQEYRAEPEIGLVSGEDGLNFTRKLLAQAADYLNENGLLVVEVGNSWPALEAAYPQVAFFWPEFSNGGHGVFVLTREQLINI